MTQSEPGVLAKAEAMVGAVDIAKTDIGHSLKVNLDQAPTVPIRGSSHPPKRCKAFGKECYYCHKKATFHNTADLNNREDHPPNPGTMLDNHAMISMT